MEWRESGVLAEFVKKRITDHDTTHDEDESWLDECRKIVYIQSHAYIFNSSTLFNNVPMAQWSTLMPCNWEAAGSNLWGFGSFLKCAHYEVDYCGKKTYLAGLQCTLTSSCAKTTMWKPIQSCLIIT